MPTKISSGIHNDNPAGTPFYLTIEGISNVRLYVNATPLPGETISKIRFVVFDKNHIPLYSPELDYTGGYIDYNFGTMIADWVYTSFSGSKILHAGYGYKTNLDPIYWSGEYGNFGDATYYSKPQVNLFNVSRNTTIETQADFTIDIEASPVVYVTEYNFLKYKRQYFDTTWIDMDILTTAAGLTLNTSNSYDLPFLADKSYTTRIVIEDLFNTVYVTDLLPTALVPFSVAKKGIGVGKIHEQGALDVQGEHWKNGILQPTVFKKKPTDPDPEGMEDGDLLFIYNDLESFSSTNFPLEFGESFIWGHNNTSGVWYTDFNYWTSLASSNNTLIESFEASTMKGDNSPSIMFVNDSNCYLIPDINLPAVIILKFKGKFKFNYFNLSGWNQDHEPKNSPKSFAFFGSNDGHKWDVIYDTSDFPDSYKITVRQAISNANYYEYLKIVYRTNQDDNSGNVTNATMIAVNKLSFEVEGFKYV